MIEGKLKLHTEQVIEKTKPKASTNNKAEGALDQEVNIEQDITKSLNKKARLNRFERIAADYNSAEELKSKLNTKVATAAETPSENIRQSNIVIKSCNKEETYKSSPAEEIGNSRDKEYTSLIKVNDDSFATRDKIKANEDSPKKELTHVIEGSFEELKSKKGKVMERRQEPAKDCVANSDINPITVKERNSQSIEKTIYNSKENEKAQNEVQDSEGLEQKEVNIEGSYTEELYNTSEKQETVPNNKKEKINESKDFDNKEEEEHKFANERDDNNKGTEMDNAESNIESNKDKVFNESKDKLKDDKMHDQYKESDNGYVKKHKGINSKQRDDKEGKKTKSKKEVPDSINKDNRNVVVENKHKTLKGEEVKTKKAKMPKKASSTIDSNKAEIKSLNKKKGNVNTDTNNEVAKNVTAAIYQKSKDEIIQGEDNKDVEIYKETIDKAVTVNDIRARNAKTKEIRNAKTSDERIKEKVLRIQRSNPRLLPSTIRDKPLSVSREPKDYLKKYKPYNIPTKSINLPLERTNQLLENVFLKYRPGMVEQYLERWCYLTRTKFFYYAVNPKSKNTIPTVSVPLEEVQSVQRVCAGPYNEGQILHQFEIILKHGVLSAKPIESFFVTRKSEEFSLNNYKEPLSDTKQSFEFSAIKPTKTLNSSAGKKLMDMKQIRNSKASKWSPKKKSNELLLVLDGAYFKSQEEKEDYRAYKEAHLKDLRQVVMYEKEEQLQNPSAWSVRQNEWRKTDQRLLFASESEELCDNWVAIMNWTINKLQ